MYIKIIDRVTRHIAVISAMLVFIGYLNLFFYYNYFDVDIGAYLSTSELIFSFLRLAVPILMGGAAYAIIPHLLDDLLKKETNSNAFFSPQKTFTEIVSSIKTLEYLRFRDKLWKTVKFYLLLLMLVLSIAFIACLPVVLLENADTGFSNVKGPSFLQLNYTILLILSVFWYILYSSVVRYVIKDSSRKSIINLTTYGSAIAIIILLLKIYNRERALDIFNGRSEYRVTLKFNDGTTLESSSSTLYLGRTANYIFFRDIVVDRTMVLTSSEVKEFTVQRPMSKLLRKLGI
jgi:hypothetical protein